MEIQVLCIGWASGDCRPAGYTHSQNIIIILKSTISLHYSYYDLKEIKLGRATFAYFEHFREHFGGLIYRLNLTNADSMFFVVIIWACMGTFILTKLHFSFAQVILYM
jgi:hypothetical protein